MNVEGHENFHESGFESDSCIRGTEGAMRTSYSPCNERKQADTQWSAVESPDECCRSAQERRERAGTKLRSLSGGFGCQQEGVGGDQTKDHGGRTSAVGCGGINVTIDGALMEAKREEGL